MFSLNCNGRLWILDEPVVMGIINTTPDSFYTGSRVNTYQSALEKAKQMIAEGASILDIGGQSTRPNSELITANEEMDRVLPIIEAIHEIFPKVMISVDTFYSAVAKAAVAAGACMVNDVSGGNIDADLISTVGTLNVPYVLTHIKGTPQTMQYNTEYEDIIAEITQYFMHQYQLCKDAGIKDVIIDPGFGFAKTVEQNFYLMQHLSAFQILSLPILAGVSRKSMIWKTLNIAPEESLNGTSALHMFLLEKGCKILRVHDVKPAMECIQLYKALMNSQP